MAKTKVFVKYEDGGSIFLMCKYTGIAERRAIEFAEKPGVTRVTMQSYPLKYNKMKVIKEPADRKTKGG